MFHGSRDTYSAVLRNIHGDNTSFEATYAVLVLQMLPHTVGFFLYIESKICYNSLCTIFNYLFGYLLICFGL